MVAHRNFRKALDFGLFTRFVVCVLYEDWDSDEGTLGPYCDYYLFGAPSEDKNSLFLVSTWNSNDL
jgi:hypothetical protein